MGFESKMASLSKQGNAMWINHKTEGKTALSMVFYLCEPFESWFCQSILFADVTIS